MDIARFRSSPVFADVPEEDLAALAAVASEIAIDEGTAVVREGDFGFTVFVVDDGTAEVVKGGQVVATLGPGDVFGEMAGQQAGRRTADVRATSPMKLMVVLNRDLWRVQERLPSIAAAIRATIDQRRLANRILADADLLADPGLDPEG